MADESLTSPTTAELFPVRRLLVDLVITGGFWIFMTLILRPHVPSDVPFWINLWAGVTALCLSGVFFMALQMFRLVLHDKRR